MKAIGISSSGRKNAYSKIILKDILEATNIDYEMIHLSELNIKGCLGCLNCATTNVCIQKDEFHDVIEKIVKADALVFGGGNYYGTLNAIGHAFWERTFALRHREAFPLAGKLCIAVGLDRDQEIMEATKFIEKMMISNRMTIVTTLTDSGHQQCYDCGCGHECLVGNVFAHMGLTTAEVAEEKRPIEYCVEAQNKSKAIGKLLGSIIKAKYGE